MLAISSIARADQLDTIVSVLPDTTGTAVFSEVVVPSVHPPTGQNNHITYWSALVNSSFNGLIQSELAWGVFDCGLFTDRWYMFASMWDGTASGNQQKCGSPAIEVNPGDTISLEVYRTGVVTAPFFGTPVFASYAAVAYDQNTGQSASYSVTLPYQQMLPVPTAFEWSSATQCSSTPSITFRKVTAWGDSYSHPSPVGAAGWGYFAPPFAAFGSNPASTGVCTINMRSILGPNVGNAEAGTVAYSNGTF